MLKNWKEKKIGAKNWREKKLVQKIGEKKNYPTFDSFRCTLQH